MQKCGYVNEWALAEKWLYEWRCLWLYCPVCTSLILPVVSFTVRPLLNAALAGTQPVTDGVHFFLCHVTTWLHLCALGLCWRRHWRALICGKQKPLIMFWVIMLIVSYLGNSSVASSYKKKLAIFSTHNSNSGLSGVYAWITFSQLPGKELNTENQCCFWVSHSLGDTDFLGRPQF